jgi:beta-lactamase superfamily II metal-dependent hydrolase
MKVENVIIGTQFEKNENLERLSNLINDKAINLFIVEAGQKINIENNLYFDVLWPNSSQAISENAINNNALVVKLNYRDNIKNINIKKHNSQKNNDDNNDINNYNTSNNNNNNTLNFNADNYIISTNSEFSMLFTGDIEAETEEVLVSKYSNTNILNSTILKAGHHGSNSSSTQEFLDLVKPKVALIGVGENNKYGHPGEEVLERLENLRYKNL